MIQHGTNLECDISCRGMYNDPTESQFYFVVTSREMWENKIEICWTVWETGSNPPCDNKMYSMPQIANLPFSG